MEISAKATITVDNKVVTFEGPQEFVDAQVEKYIGRVPSSDRNVHSGNDGQVSDLNTNAVLMERQYVLAKRPKGHPEIAAVLAFALTESGKAEFTAEEIRKAYLRAGVRPPKVVAQAIRDAKNLYEYMEAGSKRGTYKLSAHGDRTVRFDLPRHGGNKE